MASMDWADITRLHKEGRLPRQTEDAAEGAVPQLVEVALVTSDQHGRFVDWNAWRAITSILDASAAGRLGFKIERFVFNGDMLDFYELSKYPKDPAVEEPLDVDLAAWYTMISDVRSRLDNGEPIDVVPGNHDIRYELYMRSDAKKLSGLKLLELPRVLKIEEYAATFHDRAGFMFGDTRVFHGETVRQHAGESAKGEMIAWGTSGTSGHVHRLAKFMKTSDGKTLTWTESGCLCKLEAEYMVRPPNWQHGGVLMFRYSDGSVVQELVRIIDGRVQGTLGMLVHG